ncbi:MAG: hypothetical protein CMJ18_04270 [Phycisphaeraceae bacterium]|nr:hypothetical protein [Phycisphaeraceae bacterium]
MTTTVAKPDLSERGAPRDGEPQRSNRRLFMQFLALGDVPDTSPLKDALASASIDAVLYEDLNDPRGAGVLAMHEDPGFFVTTWRRLLNDGPFESLPLKQDFTMLGRTYSIGYEPDLDEVLLRRPRRTVLNPDWPWAIWYPLRRRGSFANLSSDDQRKILMEHGSIGRSYGEADYAHDIRLAAHGLDRCDNDFVIGLVGRELFPLSAIVQTMRRTVQTSQYIERLGPFFVGRAVWQTGQ